MTIEQREAPRGSGELAGPFPGHRPERDVRRKRPPLVSFLLRMETMRRLARVVSLLVLDFVGVLGALFAALLLKLLIQGNPQVDVAWHDTKQWGLFAYMITVLMFARVDLYADRARRPGMMQIATALFQVAVISLVFALASGQHFTSYYVFYGSLIIGTVFVTTLREGQLRATASLLERAGYRRRAVLVGSGRHAEAVAQAL
ncbi:MAG: hypothetical protein QOG59_2521, partial [Solirubrobacteraceae bacterium]|nr:hypothetical protein [Solirubrobacteraceae bacterium]